MSAEPHGCYTAAEKPYRERMPYKGEPDWVPRQAALRRDLDRRAEQMAIEATAPKRKPAPESDSAPEPLAAAISRKVKTTRRSKR